MKEYIKFKKHMSICDILKLLDSFEIQYRYDSSLSDLIEGVSSGLIKVDRTLCFIENIKSTDEIKEIQNSLICTSNKISNDFSDFNILYVEDARYVFIRLLEFFENMQELCSFTTSITYLNGFISPKANIHESVILEDDIVVEDNVVIGAGCIIKKGTFIGAETIIRENTIIGCSGIALYKAKNEDILRFPHVAGVYIASNVEIGANCVIVKGTLVNTYIGENTVIGNLSNIGHGVRIGKKVWISVGAMIGGNCTVEDGVTIGLSVSLKDNLFICGDSTIGMGSVVTKSLKEKTTVFGNPAKTIRPLNVGPKR